jgi:hypothetical protein
MQAQMRRPRAWSETDDRMLDAILWLRRVWAHKDGRVTLTDLGLDARLVTFVVSGLCPKHGQFVSEWTGRTSDPVPLEARCSAAERGRCHETSPVFVLV